MALCGLYLASIVIANLIAATFGPSASVATAFAMIGLTITTRDRLHDAWHHSRLWLKMLALIAAGGILSYLLNTQALPIAIASCIAFLASETTDTAVYHLLRARPAAARVNASNIASAIVDSLIFPTLAFGAIMPTIIAGQIAAKIVGGAAWLLILYHRRRQPCPPLPN